MEIFNDHPNQRAFIQCVERGLAVRQAVEGQPGGGRGCLGTWMGQGYRGRADPEARCLAQEHTIAPELESGRGVGEDGGHWPSPICSKLMVTGCCFASWVHR